MVRGSRTDIIYISVQKNSQSDVHGPLHGTAALHPFVEKRLDKTYCDCVMRWGDVEFHMQPE